MPAANLPYALTVNKYLFSIAETYQGSFLLHQLRQ